MQHSPLTRIELTNFTAFAKLDHPLSPQLNVFVGTNGTGKTHLLKLLYAAGAATQKDVRFANKLVGVFKPYENRLGRLVRRVRKSSTAKLQLHRESARITLTFSNHVAQADEVIARVRDWKQEPLKCVYIPVKEVLAQAAGFRSLYKEYELRFDETHVDLIDWALKPKRRGPPDVVRRNLLEKIEAYIAGTVSVENEEFFLEDEHGQIEFTLLGEGLRKLGLIWLLIQNGTLIDGSVLFWDEPEANLNPRVIGDVVEILLELTRHGVQVFVATHDYVFLKELDLRRKKEDQVAFHALFRPKEGRDSGVRVSTADTLATLDPNVIRDTYLGLLDREAERDFND
ncbi:AAA family ATPase [Pyxidicoccus xibeiensis]|uniref:AAA family ATPase n=1 Tax=Pyxidicoccus xibeiensis TaxID=2906759 RepID=UPI0020A77DB3|nr:ATP-binding protein [Pyxidicoccus xibeiensis]MCP3136062.1 AAA family ATPase [Pyxidicoccus xibeiensis]